MSPFKYQIGDQFIFDTTYTIVQAGLDTEGAPLYLVISSHGREYVTEQWINDGVRRYDDNHHNSRVIVFDEEPENVATFRNIAREMFETYRRKNADYGDAYAAGFEKFGPMQLLSRIYEKYERLYNLLYLNKYKQVADESVCDTLTDMAVQCIVLRMLLEKQNVDPVDFEKVE